MPFRWLMKKFRRRYERDYTKPKASKKGRSNSLEPTPSPTIGEDDGPTTPTSVPLYPQKFTYAQETFPRQPSTNREPNVYTQPDPEPQPENQLYVVLYDYDARTQGELFIRKNELVEMLNKTDNGWSYVRKTESEEVGYIPTNYIAEYNSMKAQEWFFSGMRRMECDHLLLAKGNRQGSFLIRTSETRKNEYALAVLCDGKVRNYKVHCAEDYGYFISSNYSFPTLEDLVEFYSADAAGLCTVLTHPCVKVEKPDTAGLSYDTCDKWEIPRTELKLSRLLGQGNFGEVYEGSWNGSYKVAIKTLKPGTMRKEDFLAEAQFLKSLRHKNLLQLYAVCTLEEPLYIVTELMQHGSLLSYLREGPGLRAELEELIHIAAQVASGMWYLETQNYIHRDLAARNVLIGEGVQVKVADFGLSRLVHEDEIYNAKEGGKFPIKWTAPEALSHNRFSIKSDVWSFGILLHEIVTKGSRPYIGMTNAEVQERVEQGYRMSKSPECPQMLYQIMLETWDKNPMSRPNFETLQWKLEEFFTLDHSEYKDADVVN